MKILYGVQATGNGHICRSREVILALRASGADVDVIFTGRDEELLWGVEDLKPYKVLKGFTFVIKNGKIKHIKTAFQLNVKQFLKDVLSLNTTGIDLIISDFEPVTAWAAKYRKIPSMGIGHQYAFCHTPVKGSNPLSIAVLKYFAPVKYPIGLHWHHFNQPILPPIIPTNLSINKHQTLKDKILIYLPFEDFKQVRNLLEQFTQYQFYIYCQVDIPTDANNIHLRPFSRSNFLNDLHDCNGVICNAGFELPSEALHLGKKLLVKPIAGQIEQTSNAKTLVDLKLGTVMPKLNASIIAAWLEQPANQPMGYPDVATAIVSWINKKNWSNQDTLIKKLWSETSFTCAT